MNPHNLSFNGTKCYCSVPDCTCLLPCLLAAFINRRKDKDSYECKQPFTANAIHYKSYEVAGHASGCWRSALGAGVPYNREKNESLI